VNAITEELFLKKQFVLVHKNSLPASQEQSLLALERPLGSTNIFAR
jgi:hypothetical protein